RGSCRLLQRKEDAVAPDARWRRALGQSDFGQLVIDRADDQSVEPLADLDIRVLPRVEAQGMGRPGDDEVAGVEPEGQAAVPAFAFALQLDGDEGRVLDLDVQLLRRRDQDKAAVRLAPEDGGEQADHRWPADRAALMKPGAIARDPHLAVAAMDRMPLLHRRQALFL